MSFAETQVELERWLAARQRGQVTPDQLAAAVGRLQVQDEHGRWWQPDPTGAGWLVHWEGEWRSALPPHQATAAPVSVGVSAAAAEEAAPAAAGVRPELMRPDQFLAVARSVPWRQRPQSWWDLFAILGGTLCGYLFFVYSSIRGLPRLAIFGTGRESWFDALPTVALLAVPVVVLLLRRRVMSLMVPILRAFAGIPVVVRVLLALFVVGIAWAVTRAPFFVQREGLDLVTPVLMVGLPLLLVWFRREVDQGLQPLQVVRRHVPRFVLLGAGIATPFFTAFVLYYLLGISQYPLLRLNMVVGTLLSYAILRTPLAGPARRAGPLAARGLMIAALLLVASAAAADDFYRDPFNLNDGLRTTGVAPVIAGVASVLVSMVVNGREVLVVTVQATSPSEDGKAPPRKRFVVRVDTLDARGAPSTNLDLSATDPLYVYAHCEQDGARFPAGDPTIRFTLLSAREWVAVTDLGTQHGRRCAAVSPVAPAPRGEPPLTATVDVAAGADTLVNAPVELTLEAGLRLAVERVNGERTGSSDAARPTFRVRFSVRDNQWELGELVVYFHLPSSSTPVKPSFTPVWDKPSAEPDYLDFDALVSADGGLTWRLHPRLKPEVKLTDEWLAQQGEIEVKVSCTEQPGGVPA